jgi:hypothetical protein
MARQSRSGASRNLAELSSANSDTVQRRSDTNAHDIRKTQWSMHVHPTLFLSPYNGRDRGVPARIIDRHARFGGGFDERFRNGGQRFNDPAQRPRAGKP